MPRGGALLLVTLAFVVLLAPFPSGPLQLNEHPVRYHRVFVFISDVPLLVLTAVMAARVRVRAGGGWSGLALGVVAILGLLAAALLAHPSLSGLQTVVRAAAAAAVGAAVAALDERERIFLAAMLALTALAQTLLALGQLVTGAPLGLIGIGEVPDPLLLSGTAPMPRGTMYHPYVLAGLALVSGAYLVRTALRQGRPWPWLVLATAAVIPVGVTYSRAALLGLVLGVAFLLPGVRRRSRLHTLAVLALVLGVGIPATLTIDGWLGRARSTLASPPDRIMLARQGLEIMSEEPLLGVGPSRYLDALEERAVRAPGSVSVVQEPHIVPLLVGAEAGVAAGALAIALLVLLARRAVASGEVDLFVLAIFAPILLFDHYPYTHPQGLVLLGIWAGAVVQRSDVAGP